MAPLKVGDKLPADVQFTWVPIEDEDPTKCGIPQVYDANKEWQGKKVVIVSLPGAFTPGCQARHLPPYIENLDSLQQKGVDLVVVIASNDAFVMNAWGKVNKIKSDNILLLSDTKTFFSKEHGWMLGDRNGRWAMVVEKDGTISYAETETSPGQVTVSGADAVLARL
ncbi:Redoxin [Eremomyces bilateralis CBS 781.70]|uniref:Thioredoxin peroxidase n=1 Tax=Eremomyces bilateralis CBS 781.70 TaxID=1392243 RepID=A0A6G1FTU4_9PEZI|nr:Redoxin [Eremomyces bilateralis CBS 781.70]KAF1809160.1 Redoxin [Eremomyces bilateralis CBS 781.70]